MFKKSVIGAVFLTMMTHVSFADTAQGAEKIHQKERALALYAQQRYEESYSLLANLYLSDLTDEELHLHLGLSAYETKRYETALAAFERCQMLNPQNGRYAYEMGRTYYALGMHEDAERELQPLREDPSLSESDRHTIRSYLAVIDQRRQKSFFTATLSAGVMYDSNVNYGPLDDSFYTPNSKPEMSDFGYDVHLGAEHLYDIGEKNGYQVRNRIALFNREYDTLEEYDVTYLSYAPTLLYQSGQTLCTLTASLDHMWLHHESYLNVYSILPAMVYELDEKSRLITYVRYHRKYFLRSADEAKDADNYEFSLGYRHTLPTAYWMIRAGADRERKTDSNTPRIDVDFNRYRLNAEYAAQLSPTLSAKGEAEIHTRAYRDHFTVFGNTREDNGYKAGVSLTHKFTPTMYAEAKATYERTWSNQSVYAYDKHTCSVTLNKKF
jgi:tetratricopeptide (TPR) repeat protein